MAHFSHTELQQLHELTLEITGANYVHQRQNYFTDLAMLDLPLPMGQTTPRLLLWGDLNFLNDENRLTLADGVVPMEYWLRNVLFLNPGHRRSGELKAFLRIAADTVASVGELATKPVDVTFRPEAFLGTDERLSYRFLERGYRFGKSVAKLLVPKVVNGAPVLGSDNEPLMAKGTCWLITPNLVVTNHHVVAVRERGEAPPTGADLNAQAGSARAQFDYNASGDAGHWVNASALEFADADLDYAVLRLNAPQDRPLPELAAALPVANATAPERINTIQHAFGDPKQVAIRNNLLFDVSSAELRYTTDTEVGSSGSPLFDDAWRLVGLHRGARRELGPDAPASVVNVGTTWPAIAAHLKAERETLWQEIQSAANTA